MNARDEPLVSVIVPALNAERFLARTLASASGQTWRRLEILVVDDGSTDRTPLIAAAAARKDPRIRLLHQENRGVAAARNRAIAVARGALLAPLDADDLWHPDYLSRQVAALAAAGSDTALSYAWWVSIDDNDRVQCFMPPIRVRGRRHALRRMVFCNFIGNGSSAVMRRSAVEAVGGYDTSLLARDAQGCEDTALYIALAERWDFTLAGDHLVGYRRHPDGMSRDERRMSRSDELVRDDLYRRRPDLPHYWRIVAHAREPQRALWRALKGGNVAAARAALRVAGSHGPLCLAAMLGYWGVDGVMGALSSARHGCGGRLGADLTRLWAIQSPRSGRVEAEDDGVQLGARTRRALGAP